MASNTNTIHGQIIGVACQSCNSQFRVRLPKNGSPIAFKHNVCCPVCGKRFWARQDDASQHHPPGKGEADERPDEGRTGAPRKPFRRQRYSYLSPLRLLGWTPDEARTADAKTLRHRLKILEAELSLSADGRLALNGRMVGGRQALSVIGELLDTQKREAHVRIAECPPLLRFLRVGDSAFFAETSSPSANFEDPAFIAFVSPFFAEAYTGCLRKVGETCDAEAITRITHGHLLLTEKDRERCFEAAMLELRERFVVPIKQLKAMDEQGQRNVILLNLLNVRFLNALPPYFQPLRNEIAEEATRIASAMWNSGIKCKATFLKIDTLVLTGEIRDVAWQNKWITLSEATVPEGPVPQNIVPPERLSQDPFEILKGCFCLVVIVLFFVFRGCVNRSDRDIRHYKSMQRYQQGFHR